MRAGNTGSSAAALRYGTRSSIFEALCAIAAAALSVWVLLTSIAISRAGWVTIPTADDWDRWITYVRDHYTLWWFFQQHVDHRLAAPKVLFAVDHLAFHARGWFLLVCAFCFQAVTGVLLWKLAGRAYPQERAERLMQAAVIASCVFSGQQWINFTWPFQVQFPMVYCAAAAALFALWKGAQPDSRHSVAWISGSIALAAVATYSMANGTLVWPMLLTAAAWMRLPRRRIAALAAGTVLLGATYFYHWHRTTPGTPRPLAEHLRRTVIFGLAHLGSPTASVGAWRGDERFQLAFAAAFGALMLLALLAACFLLWWRREHYKSARAMLLFYSVFIAVSSAGIAYGRSDEMLTEAFSPRYLTPSYLLWVSMLLVLWPLLRRVNRLAFHGALCAGVLLGIAVHQRTALYNVRGWAAGARLGEVAVIDNVTDPEPWRTLYHSPPITTDAVQYLKNNQLAIFTEEWTHWPGIPLQRRFFIDRNPDACQGQFDQTIAIPSTLQPGWRISGWAWDAKARQSPRYLIFGDDTGVVAGVALTGFPLPAALSALSPRYTAATWTGYVNGPPRAVTAYVLEADERSLCAIGSEHLHSVGREVAFTDLEAPLAGGTTQIGGAWTSNGYYIGPGGPGAPPVPGAVFGSFPDAATGTIHLGPFHLDGHAGIAIPLVTGPDNHNLSVTIRNTATGEVLAALNPPPVRMAWWAWRPDLPPGGDITIEVVAEDKGTGWGQWAAVAWPHLLRQ